MEIWKPTFNQKVVSAALAVASFGTIILAAGSASATLYGDNITIYDGVGNGSGAVKEENEAEPGMIQSQAWDLEGFFLNGSSLTIVGGYNFYTGQDNIMSGDIFIDTNGDAVASPNVITAPGFTYTPYEQVSNSYFKYDYVLDVNWQEGTFNIVKLDNSSILVDTMYGSQYNIPSNPWRYLSGGVNVNTTPLAFNDYQRVSQDQTNTGTGFLGWGNDDKHYAASFDLSAINLALRNGALFHNTMECGNDNLLGRSAPVPEPATMLLVGTGLAGILGLRRRKKA